jgi:hypothetical protein
VVVAGYCSVVPVSMLGLVYRIVFVLWKHGDGALMYCRVNLVVPFARELKHLTICRPAPRFIVSCLTDLFFSPTLESMETRTAFTPQRDTGMRRITTFRLTTDLIYDGGSIRLYYNTVVLQLPTVFNTVTCCTGL